MNNAPPFGQEPDDLTGFGPVDHAYADGLCASGAYYIAASADKIYSSNESIIGSIGVVANCFNISKLLDKLGIDSLAITEGKDKDIMNPLRPWKENEEAPLREIASQSYNNFVDVVAAARPSLNKEKIINDYGARVFSSLKAQECGFIDDGNSNRETVLSDLIKAANISDEYQVIQLLPKRWMDHFLKDKFSLLSGKMVHEIQIGPRKMVITDDYPYLCLYQPGSSQNLLHPFNCF